MATGKYCYRYPHPAVSADCVLFGYENSRLYVLLIERGNEPYRGSWAFPGGFMEIDETAHQCALRELQEETGLKLVELEQLGAFTDVNRDPRERVLTVAFYAVVHKPDFNAIAGDDAARAQWFPLGIMPKLAFDHKVVLHQAVESFRDTLFLSLNNRAKFLWAFTDDEKRLLLQLLDSL